MAQGGTISGSNLSMTTTGLGGDGGARGEYGSSGTSGVGGTGGIERDLLVVLLTEELIGGIFF